MKTVAKWVLRLLVLLLLVVLLAVVYVQYGDLSRHVGRFESALSGAVGHEIDLGREFDIEIGEIVTVAADDVTISNSTWDGRQDIVRMGSVLVSIDAWSLYEPPIVIRQLEIDELRVTLATNADGNGNWVPASASAEDAGGAPISIEIVKLSLKDVEFAIDAVTAALTGEINGSVKMTLAQTPEISIDLQSPVLKLAMPSTGDDEVPSDDAPLFSDDVFDTTIFEALRATASVDIAEFAYEKHRIADLVLRSDLNENGLDVSTLSFAAFNGAISTAFTLVPANDGIEMEARAEATGLYVGSPWSMEASFDSLPRTSGSANLSGSGSSWREIMALSSGELDVTQESGRLKEIAGSGLFGDLIVQVFQTLNPLSSEKPYTSLECAYYKLRVTDGVATIDDLSLQTDDMMIIGDGKILFADESVDVSVRAKPREGLGISLGGVANSFVKLGGKLRSPELQFDAAGTATTTGAAVATGGLSLLARGLWDRLSAINDICVADDEPITDDSDSVEE